jgi:hypothetical protein
MATFISNRPHRALFPALRWAWPAAGLDQLLLAALCPDEARASEALDHWLATHDIEESEYRDHRLLVAITNRFGSALANHPAGPRLVGLQRHLWTRSRLAIAHANAALQSLIAAGIPTMLLKGAARIAADPNASRARLAHDVDVLVPPEHFAAAIGTLAAAEWKAASGESELRLQKIAPSLRAMNFFRDRYGDIDLHQWAYGDLATHPSLHRDLWERAIPANFFGTPVSIPSETDRAVLAIVNCGLDAHTHSDWLIDCAPLFTHSLDWDRLLEILRQTNSVLPAQVALTYLADNIGLPIPRAFIQSLLQASTGGPMRRALALLQAKPRANWTPLTRASRGVAKQWSRLGRSKHRRPSLVISGRFATPRSLESHEPMVSRQEIAQLTGKPLAVQIRLALAVEMPGNRRRVEFELNTSSHHVARLSARSLRRRQGVYGLRFQGKIELPAETGPLYLEARPGRQLRGGESTGETARYQALPCRIMTCQLSDLPTGA